MHNDESDRNQGLAGRYARWFLRAEMAWAAGVQNGKTGLLEAQSFTAVQIAPLPLLGGCGLLVVVSLWLDDKVLLGILFIPVLGGLFWFTHRVMKAYEQIPRHEYDAFWRDARRQSKKQEQSGLHAFLRFMFAIFWPLLPMAVAFAGLYLVLGAPPNFQ